MHSTPNRQPGREVRNKRPARKPEHRCNVAVRARIVWDDDGSEIWMDTVAHGWSGQDVYVDATPIRISDNYRMNYVWLAAGDVERL